MYKKRSWRYAAQGRNGLDLGLFGLWLGLVGPSRWEPIGPKKGLGTDDILWYYFVAFDALVSPLER